MMRIGFTGSQIGMSVEQRRLVTRILLQHPSNTQFHHGDCIGSDEQAHHLAFLLGLEIHLHPPIDPRKRAHCTNVTQCYREKPYLDRDRDIVDMSDYLLAAPSNAVELRRSGTWYTIRHAVRQNRSGWILYPDGRIEDLKDWVSEVRGD